MNQEVREWFGWLLKMPPDPGPRIINITADLGGWGGPWFCDECGGVMSVGPAGVSLCAPCSAAREGKVPCPADHQGNKKACPLCRGAGFVDAL